MAKGKKKSALLLAAIALVAALMVSMILIAQNTAAANIAPRYGRLNANRFVDISIGYYFGGALDEDGVVWVWGQNGSGQLGNGKSISTTTGQGYAGTAQPVPGLPKIRQFSAGESYGMALDYDGDAWCWGYNAEWQCGNFKAAGNAVQRLPIKLDRAAYGIPKLVKVTGGVFHSAALDENGAVWCWGLNNAGQLGRGTSGRPSNYNENIPGKAVFPAGVAIVDVEAGRDNTVALDSQGNVWCWGRNSQAECANGKTTFVPTPHNVVFPAGTPKIVQISLENGWVLALDEGGAVWQWGFVWGRRAFASTDYIKAPETVEFDATKRIVPPAKGSEKAKFAYDSTYTFPGIASIHAGHRTSYAIDKNGKIWTWGDNEFYGFGMVSDFYLADYCRVPIWSKTGVQSPTITGNGDQNTTGKQISFLHPQVAGSASDPLKHPEYPKREFPGGFWNEMGLGIDPNFAEVPMPYAEKITTFCSSYVVLDADGNLWQWSYDSIGTICWGAEPMQVPLPSHAKWAESGLWDLFIHEPVLMRGAGKYVPPPEPETTTVPSESSSVPESTSPQETSTAPETTSHVCPTLPPHECPPCDHPPCEIVVLTGFWISYGNFLAQAQNCAYANIPGTVTETGVLYSGDAGLAGALTATASANGNGFSPWLAGLSNGTWYYQAYVKNSLGDIYYGEVKQASYP